MILMIVKIIVVSKIVLHNLNTVYQLNLLILTSNLTYLLYIEMFIRYKWPLGKKKRKEEEIFTFFFCSKDFGYY